jgi:cation diffusion facilitator family transporter
MSASGGKKAIFAALGANAGIALAKFVGFAVTGSSSMAAEAVHSLADTSNQGLLLLGQKRAAKAPDALHQFGYARSRYFYSFVVALVLFSLGSLFALYEGIGKIRDPEHLENAFVAIVILLLAIALEGFSFFTAMRESRGLKGDSTWWGFIRGSRTPELPIVLLEDSGALVGLLLALAGVGLTIATGNPVWDGIGTLGIGVLLGIIAIILIVEMHSLLIGEGVTPKQEGRIASALVDGKLVLSVIHARTQYLGPDDVLLAAKIEIAPGSDIGQVADAIDAAEERVRAAVPEVKMIYLEPDLRR